jgi:general secretion pathway protein I
MARVGRTAAARRAQRPTRARRGFTLLEVMVAIAILGLVLTVILSAQGGLAASNRSAANMGQAVALGRCKMTELEEKSLKFGLPLIDEIDQEVSCCENEDREGFRCDTRVEKVELPNFTDGNSLGDGGVLTGPAGEAIQSLAGPAGSGAGGPGLNLDVDAGLSALNNLNPALGLSGSGGAGAQGLISMVMGIVYPVLKPMFEASIRRLTVTVKWKEGPNARELPLVQYITNPQQGGFAANALLPDGGAMDFGGGATGSSPGGSTGLPGGGGSPFGGGGTRGIGRPSGGTR